MNSTVLRCKRETAENETKSGAHTWQRDCAHVMNSTVLRCKRETAENETKSGAHTWQRDCAHTRLVTRDGEIEITVTVARTVGRINFAPVARLGGLAPARPIIYLARARCTTRWARSRSPNNTQYTIASAAIPNSFLNPAGGACPQTPT